MRIHTAIIRSELHLSKEKENMQPECTSTTSPDQLIAAIKLLLHITITYSRHAATVAKGEASANIQPSLIL